MIKDERELENTLRKLRELKRLCADAEAKPHANKRVHELALKSYRTTIRQFEEEIAQYRAAAQVGANG